MSKMMPAFASKLKRKQPTVKVQAPSDLEPEAKDTKGLVQAAYTGATQSTLQSATENAFSIRKPSSAKHTWLTAFSRSSLCMSCKRNFMCTCAVSAKPKVGCHGMLH